MGAVELTRRCEICPNKQGKAKDTTDKQLGSTVDEVCDVTCTSGCNVCTDTTSHCLNCAAGYFWGGSAKCTLCSNAKGKGVDTDDMTGGTALTVNACTTSCSGGCEACTATQTECLNCRAGYFWAGAGATCTLCSDGKGKAKDEEDKTGKNFESCGLDCTASFGCNACQGVNSFYEAQ